jgi:hypothetical protein
VAAAAKDTTKRNLVLIGGRGCVPLMCMWCWSGAGGEGRVAWGDADRDDALDGVRLSRSGFEHGKPFQRRTRGCLGFGIFGGCTGMWPHFCSSLVDGGMRTDAYSVLGTQHGGSWFNTAVYALLLGF